MGDSPLMKSYFNRILLITALLMAAVTLGGCCVLAGHGLKCVAATP
jgi:hypothetical protein